MREAASVQAGESVREGESVPEAESVPPVQGPAREPGSVQAAGQPVLVRLLGHL